MSYVRTLDCYRRPHGSRLSTSRRQRHSRPIWPGNVAGPCDAPVWRRNLCECLTKSGVNICLEVCPCGAGRIGH